MLFQNLCLVCCKPFSQRGDGYSADSCMESRGSPGSLCPTCHDQLGQPIKKDAGVDEVLAALENG